MLDYWHPSEKAMYPDYFSKREQWKKLRMQSWDKEVGCSATCLFAWYILYTIRAHVTSYTILLTLKHYSSLSLTCGVTQEKFLWTVGVTGLNELGFTARLLDP